MFNNNRFNTTDPDDANYSDLTSWNAIFPPVLSPQITEDPLFPVIPDLGSKNVSRPVNINSIEILPGHYIYKEYHDNGVLKIEALKTSDNKFNGRYLEYYLNGKFKIKAYMRNNQIVRDRTYEYYNENGIRMI